MDFKNPKVISDKKIFTEKQLREFTSTYSVDRRDSIFGFFSGLVQQKEQSSEPTVLAGQNKVAGALKNTVSPAVLEEKTAQFVKGSLDAKGFYNVLSAAFGPKLSAVLPEILASLPQAKASDLKKVAK